MVDVEATITALDVFKGHSNSHNSGTDDAVPKIVLTGWKDGRLQILHLDKTGSVLSTTLIATLSEDVGQVRWTKQEGVLKFAVVLTGDVRLFQGGSLDSIKQIAVLKNHDLEVTSICWSHDGSLVASSGADSKCVVSSSVTFEKLNVIDIKGCIASCAFSPASNNYITCCMGRELYVYDLATSTTKPQFQTSSKHSLFALDWSPDAKYLCMGSNRGALSTVNLNEKIPRVTTTVAHEFTSLQTVEQVRFSPSVLKSLEGTSQILLSLCTIN